MPSRPSPKNIKVFISYRNIPLSKQEGNFLATALKQDYGYEVFIDTQELKNKGGVKWAETIYENIHNSDVLIVLLEQETHLSEWVQREVDVARGAHVSILPIAIIGEAELGKVLREVQEKLAITEMQFLPFNSGAPAYEPLIESIESLAKRTRDTQKSWQEHLRDRRYARRAEPTEQPPLQYEVAPGRFISLLTGDMTELQGIDVLVNSENNYMQMARIYENTALSSALRREGSHIKNGRIYEDTVQMQLDYQIMHSPYFGSRPIEMEQVVATQAGHAKSKLVKNGGRYIFHVATVYVHPRDRTIKPIQTDASIRQAVNNCLDLFMELHESKGVISPEGAAWRAQEEANAAHYDQRPLRSIVFPLFGAGQGGRSTLEVAPPMLRTFREFLKRHARTAGFPLEQIHLCVYGQADVDDVAMVMKRVLG